MLVEDHPGVLNRVVSLLRRRSFNIDSITVGHSEQPGVSRMTIVVIGETNEVEQAGKQLYKLMEVLKVTDVTISNCVAHEMALIKVAAKAQHRGEILQIAQIYKARVVDASPTTLLMEMTGTEEKIDALLTMLRGFGIRELVRTGPVAMMRGAATVSVKGDGHVAEREQWRRTAARRRFRSKSYRLRHDRLAITERRDRAAFLFPSSSGQERRRSQMPSDRATIARFCLDTYDRSCGESARMSGHSKPGSFWDGE